MDTRFRAPSPVLAAAQAHHAALRDRLTQLTEAFIDEIAAGSANPTTRAELLAFLRTELLPHAEVEDRLLYTAVRTDRTVLLVRAMQDEHRMIALLIDEVETATTPIRSAVAAGALMVLCDVRIEQENVHLLPTLEAAGIDLADLLGDHPELIGTTGANPS